MVKAAQTVLDVTIANTHVFSYNLPAKPVSIKLVSATLGSKMGWAQLPHSVSPHIYYCCCQPLAGRVGQGYRLKCGSPLMCNIDSWLPETFLELHTA